MLYPGGLSVSLHQSGVAASRFSVLKVAANPPASRSVLIGLQHHNAAEQSRTTAATLAAALIAIAFPFAPIESAELHLLR
jgi:hypothetical protein